MDYSIYKEYIDHESGGKADRPQFQQLFQDAHQRRFGVVLFWALDPFSREGVTETLNHLQRLTASGVQYKSYTEQYLDSTGIFKDAIIGILTTVAKQERVRLGERTKAGLAKALAQGKTLRRPCMDSSMLTHMQRLKDSGASNRFIAKQLSISASTVSKCLLSSN